VVDPLLELLQPPSDLLVDGCLLVSFQQGLVRHAAPVEDLGHIGRWQVIHPLEVPREPLPGGCIRDQTEQLRPTVRSLGGGDVEPHYLRDAVGFLTYLTDNGAVAILDPQMLRLWSPADWRKELFDPDGPVPHRHVVILTSDEDQPGLLWFHTRGMRKFGRPDLSLHGVAESQRAAVLDLFNRLIELQAMGGIVAEGQDIRLAALPSGMTCHLRGAVDDPDFNNVHIEIVAATLRR